MLDIFGGSNTTGFAAESLDRKWLTFEMSQDYLASSVFRFLEGRSSKTVMEVLEELSDRTSDFLIDETILSLATSEKVKAKKADICQGQLLPDVA